MVFHNTILILYISAILVLQLFMQLLLSELWIIFLFFYPIQGSDFVAKAVEIAAGELLAVATPGQGRF